MVSKKKKRLILAASLIALVAVVFGTGVVLTSVTAYEDDRPHPAVRATQPGEHKNEEVKPYFIPDELSDVGTADKESKTVTLNWEKSDNATEYKIYRAAEKKNKKLGKLKLRAVVSGTGFKDKVRAAKKYKYKITPVRSIMGTTTEGKSKTIRLMSRPDKIKKVKVVKTGASEVKLKWSKHKDANTYVVSRAAEKSNGKLGKYKQLCTTQKRELTDKNLSSGRVYSYRVCAKRVSGSLSAVSDGKSAKAFTQLTAPKTLEVKKTSFRAVRLLWTKVSPTVKYRVYRGDKKIKTVSENTFTDRKLDKAMVYKYTVRAVKKVDGKVYESKPVECFACTNVPVAGKKNGIGGTWVQVSLASQTLTMYVDNKVYLTTPVVTGNFGALGTMPGVHHVISRKSPARLRGSYNGARWDTTVNYWLGFTYSGQGIHDSTWRHAYGGSIYRGNGSHGCVNTPLSAVAKVYEKGFVGMPVWVY